MCIRDSYLLPQNQPFYEFSLKLWENLERELNYNSMVSQRGVLNIFHSDSQRDAFVRRGNAMLMSGADASLLGVDDLKKMVPFRKKRSGPFPALPNVPEASFSK